MVTALTMKEYFSAYTSDPVDEASDIIKSLLNFPPDTRLYRRSDYCRQWAINQSQGYSYYVVFEVLNYESEFLSLCIHGNWRNYVDGLSNLSSGIKVFLADYQTPKEAVEALCSKFIERFQKPDSRGNVKVFYDESEFLWCWKRPTSSKITYNFDRTKAYHAETCVSVMNILGEDVVPDERRFLDVTERNNIINGQHPEITAHEGNFYFNEALSPIYYNQIPFTEIHSRVPVSSLGLYEFVLVNDKRVYINLKRTKSSLISTPIHSYSTRIEGLVPANKLFLLGKADLYAKRDKAEVPFLGWELEACSNLSTVGSKKSATAFKEHMPWLIMCKNDGSISPEGFETVSVPATLDFWQESNLSSSFDSMRVAPHNMRSFEHEACGFHVHVSRSALSVLDLQKLERFIHNPENKNFIVSVAGRGAGQYQKYIPDLFSNRKKWYDTDRSFYSARLRQVVEEGIAYFTMSLSEAHEAVITRLSVLPQGSNYRQRLVNMGRFFSDFVSYDSLNTIIQQNSEISNRYPNFAFNYSIDNVIVDLRREVPVLLTEMCSGRDDPTSSDEHNELFRFLVQDVLCPRRPKFSALVKKFFPEWELIVEEIVRESTISDREFINTRKSSAPFKRSLSHTASQVLKGPTGKGVNSRYDALNTTNKSTVEFRMFKGTMNGSTVMRYLEFVDAMIRFVAHTSATDAGLHYTAFIAWLRSDSFNIARYEHLVSFITEKGFIDRKDIRKKTLPIVVSEDKDIKGLVAIPAKGFEEATEVKAIGSFTLEQEREEVIPFMTPEQASEQYNTEEVPEYDEGEEDPIGQDGCNCLDCVERRGYEM